MKIFFNLLSGYSKRNLLPSIIHAGISLVITLILTAIISGFSFEGIPNPIFAGFFSFVFSAAISGGITYAITTNLDFFKRKIDNFWGLKIKHYNVFYNIFSAIFLILSIVLMVLFVIRANEKSFSDGGDVIAFVCFRWLIIHFFGFLSFYSMAVRPESSFACNGCGKIGLQATSSTYLKARNVNTQTITYVPSTYKEIGTLKEKDSGKEYSITTGEKGHFSTQSYTSTVHDYLVKYSCYFCGHQSERTETKK